MRIGEVHIYQKDLPLKQPYTMASRLLQSLDSTIVKLVCDNGHLELPLAPGFQGKAESVYPKGY